MGFVYVPVCATIKSTTCWFWLEKLLLPGSGLGGLTILTKNSSNSISPSMCIQSSSWSTLENHILWIFPDNTQATCRLITHSWLNAPCLNLSCQLCKSNIVSYSLMFSRMSCKVQKWKTKSKYDYLGTMAASYHSFELWHILKLFLELGHLLKLWNLERSASLQKISYN